MKEITVKSSSPEVRLNSSKVTFNPGEVRFTSHLSDSSLLDIWLFYNQRLSNNFTITIAMAITLLDLLVLLVVSTSTCFSKGFADQRQQMSYTLISGSAIHSSRMDTTLTCDQQRSSIQDCSAECFQMAGNGTLCPGFFADKSQVGPCYICHISNLTESQTMDGSANFTNNHFLYLRTYTKTKPEVAMDFEDFSSESNTIQGSNVNGTTNGITVSNHVAGVRGKGIYFNHGAKITLSGFEHECWTNIEHCTDGLTLSIWIKLEEITTAYVVGSGAIFQRGVDIFSLASRFSMMVSLDDQRFYAWSTTTAVVDTWYLVTGTYHPTDGNSVYVNGILEAENRFDTPANNPVNEVDWRAHIGVRDSTPYNTDPVIGTVDEFKYYYRILNTMGMQLNLLLPPANEVTGFSFVYVCLSTGRGVPM